MTIAEGNELIADFYGLAKGIRTGLYLDNSFFGIEIPSSAAELRFHSSWKWLMPVVEKIESLGYRFPIELDGCCVCYTETGDEQTSNKVLINHIKAQDGKKITATYQAACEFIKWHNKK